MRHRLRSAAVLAVLLLAAPVGLHAEEGGDDAISQAKALLVQIDAAEKAKDDGALSDALKKVAGLYKQVKDNSLENQLMKALGSAVKTNKYPAARKVALEGLVETGDGKEAWKAMERGYPDDDVEDPERFNVDFVKAVGVLHPDAAIDRLLETFKKAKQVDLSAEAVLALGQYGKSKQRERVLLEIVKAGKNMIPSQSPGKNPSAETRARWAAVAGPIGKALDTLTGDKVGDPTEWFKRVDDAKKNLKSLFRE